MLQEILRRKLMEQAQMAQEQQHAASLAEAARRSNMDNSLGNRRVDEDARQFDGMAPTRIANVAHSNASTEALNRQPVEAEKARTFTAGESEKGRTFTGGQGDLNRQNAVRITGMQGANALKVANVRHPDGTAPAAAAQQEKEQNEVEDTLKIIQQIREHKSLPTATGPIQGRGLGLLQDLGGVTRVRGLHDQLSGRMQLAASGKLKGQGAISNMEREILAKAASSLALKLDDPDYLEELANVEGQFKRMLTGPRSTGAPAAAPAAATETPEQRIKRLLGGG
jgi:hypothetical protein